MAKINISVNSLDNTSLIDGRYWFVVRFYNSVGNLINNPNFPQNQVVSINSSLSEQIEIEIGDGNYTISNVVAKLFPLHPANGNEKNLNNIPINCAPAGCVNPFYGSAALVNPICNNGITTNIGQYNLIGLSNYDKYTLYIGTPSVGGYSTATNSSSTSLSVSVNFPDTSGEIINYTLRLYNGGNECYTDTQFTATYQECISYCCGIDLENWTIDVPPIGTINCDLIQNSDPEYRLLSGQKQIRVHVYSGTANIGPFTVRIYNQQDNLAQTLSGVSNIGDWLNINNSLNADTYGITIEDNRGCLTGKRTVVVTGGSCDLVHTASPNYQLDGSQKQIKANIYSGVAGIGPFTYRIYSGVFVAQTITGITSPSNWVNISNALSAGSYDLEVIDNRGCVTPTKPSFTII